MMFDCGQPATADGASARRFFSFDQQFAEHASREPLGWIDGHRGPGNWLTYPTNPLIPLVPSGHFVLSAQVLSARSQHFGFERPAILLI
jgi:hypothetical protein